MSETAGESGGACCVPATNMASASVVSEHCVPVNNSDVKNSRNRNNDDEGLPSSSNHCIPLSSKDEHGNQECIPLIYPSSPAPLPAETPTSSWWELARKLSSEFLGTATLVFVVVGSGIAGENLSADTGMSLLINAVATMAGLYCLISILGPVSGAHFNPCVSLVDVLMGDMSLRNMMLYILVQTSGAIVGCVLANVQYDVSTTLSHTTRRAPNLWLSEVLATASLLVVIHGCIRTGNEQSVPTAVSVWVGGGYFTFSSSIFANPAVTIGRIFTDTFAGIEATSALIYIGFQLVGAVVGYAMIRGLYPHKPPSLKSDDVLYKRACVLVNQDFFVKATY